MMRKTYTCFWVAALTTALIPAYSLSFFSQNDFNRKGFYLTSGVGVGGATELPSEVTVGSRIDPSDFVWEAGAGYQFSSYFSVQADYLSFQNANSDVINFSVSAPNYYQLTGYDVLAKLMLPVGSSFTFNGYVGTLIARENAYNILEGASTPLINRNTTDVMPLIGLGVEYFFRKYISLGASYFYAPKTGTISAIQYGIPFSLSIHFS